MKGKKMKVNKIKILVVEPYKDPYELEIEHKLENLQKIVGGLIEVIELEPNVDLICNDEGKLLKLPLNRAIEYDIIAGTFFIAGQKNGETISLTKEQIEKYKEIFKFDIDKIRQDIAKAIDKCFEIC